MAHTAGQRPGFIVSFWFSLRAYSYGTAHVISLRGIQNSRLTKTHWGTGIINYLCGGGTVVGRTVCLVPNLGRPCRYSRDLEDRVLCGGRCSTFSAQAWKTEGTCPKSFVTFPTLSFHHRPLVGTIIICTYCICFSANHSCYQNDNL